SRTIETASINTIWAMDAVEKAASGHPGTPTSLAPRYCLTPDVGGDPYPPQRKRARQNH
ncbi:MAG: hypothetical protein H0U02_13930, partial [Rubrobacter sp.]|nr:hypothetical protein [Rubrobacter sp.]